MFVVLDCLRCRAARFILFYSGDARYLMGRRQNKLKYIILILLMFHRHQFITVRACADGSISYFEIPNEVIFSLLLSHRELGKWRFLDVVQFRKLPIMVEPLCDIIVPFSPARNCFVYYFIYSVEKSVPSLSFVTAYHLQATKVLSGSHESQTCHRLPRIVSTCMYGEKVAECRHCAMRNHSVAGTRCAVQSGNNH